MTEEQGLEIFYRFCGNYEPHAQHIFWRDHGIQAGGQDYDCLGWMTWQM